MNLKFYLRGLGVGMLVTAVVMAILSGNGKESLSDDEIKSRAKELGMIENVVLSEIGTEKEQQENSVEEENSALPATSPEMNPSPLPEDIIPENEMDETTADEDTAIEEEDTSTETSDSSDTSTVTSTTPATSGMGLPAEDVKESVSIEIKSGDGSFSVSKKLEAAGAITSASDFDTFLCSNGYDKKIRVGSYTIPADADYETIAAAIIVR